MDMKNGVGTIELKRLYSIEKKCSILLSAVFFFNFQYDLNPKMELDVAL